MFRTASLLWLLSPCGLLAVVLGGGDSSKEHMQNQEFVALATNYYRFEIEAGGLAYAQGTDERIVEHGARMASDYGEACTELAALAALKGWNVPDDLSEKEQQMLDELTTLEGVVFDREFVRKMVLAHEAAIALFEEAAGPNGVRDDELREWAAEKLPMLKLRLQTELELVVHIEP